MDVWRVALAMVSGYVLGSVPVANFVTLRRGHFDLRLVGDRNPGYWNAKEQIGARSALPIFVGDTAKGVVAALVGRWFGDFHGHPWWIGYLAAGAAMVGHAWPLFAGWRGGRSILTFCGAALVLSPVAALIAAACCAAVSLATHRFAWGARFGIFAYPAVQLLFDTRVHVAATGGLMAIIGLRFLMAHRSAAGTNAT